MRTIAWFTEPDASSMYVREADEAFCLGPAQYVDEQGRLTHWSTIRSVADPTDRDARVHRIVQTRTYAIRFDHASPPPPSRSPSP